MTEIPMKMLWMGEDVETLHRDVLIEIIRQLSKEVESARRCTASIIEITNAERAARRRG